MVGGLWSWSGDLCHCSPEHGSNSSLMGRVGAGGQSLAKRSAVVSTGCCVVQVMTKCSHHVAVIAMGPGTGGPPQTHTRRGVRLGEASWGTPCGVGESRRSHPRCQLFRDRCPFVLPRSGVRIPDASGQGILCFDSFQAWCLQPGRNMAGHGRVVLGFPPLVLGRVGHLHQRFECRG